MYNLPKRQHIESVSVKILILVEIHENMLSVPKRKKNNETNFTESSLQIT